MEILNREDLIDLIYGASYFGGGGGGSMEEGIKLLDELEEDQQKLELIQVEEMEADPDIVSVTVAALGSPVATKGKTFSEESVNAIKGMKEEAAAEGKTLKYIYSGEQGGGNTMLPLYAAIQLGMQVLDTDGNGRAVPELNTGLMPIHDVPTSPVVLASDKNDVIVARTGDPLDSVACENIARALSVVYNMGIGFSAWLANKDDHMRASALGQITLSRKLGNLLRTTEADKLPQALEDLLGKDNVFIFMKEGTITHIDLNTAGGFDDGVTTIEDADGNKLTIRFQNENLVMFNADGKAITTVPDIISLVNIGEGLPLRAMSNSETEVGQKVMVISTRANERWSDPNGYECWNNVLMDAGYSTAAPKVEL